MPRYLSMQRSIVPSGDREEFRRKMSERLSFFRGADCRSWFFEEVGLAGALIEFVEANDEKTLREALRSAPGSNGAHARIYQEVEPT
jgi:hypothetical protein